MSWFTDIVQDYYNLQVTLDSCKAEFEKLATAYRLLEATHKECSREKE